MIILVCADRDLGVQDLALVAAADLDLVAVAVAPAAVFVDPAALAAYYAEVIVVLFPCWT